MIKASHSVRINRPVEDVYNYLRNHENRIYWQGNLVQHEPQATPEGTKVTEVRNVLGRRIEITGVLKEVEPNRIIEFSGSGPHVQRVDYRYTLHRDGDGTRFETSMEVELPSKLGIAEPVIQRLSERELDHAGNNLKDLLEQQEVERLAKELPSHTHQQSPINR